MVSNFCTTADSRFGRVRAADTASADVSERHERVREQAEIGEPIREIEIAPFEEPVPEFSPVEEPAEAPWEPAREPERVPA